MEAIQDILDKAANEIKQKKDELLFKRICERVSTDIPIKLPDEYLKRFPRIKCEWNSSDQSEHWYYNDGSDYGIHLISFYQGLEDTKLTNDLGKFTIGFNYK